MMLNIKIYPDNILRQKCKDIEKIGQEEKRLAQNMLETMYKNDGAGLAAPQIGVLKKIIVIDIGQGPLILFNPKIIEKTGRAWSTEGCLSIPGIILKVKRAKNVEVEGLNKNNKNVKIKAEGYLAYALQHEIDHLSGILVLDRISFWKKLIQRNVLKRLK